MVQVPLNEIKRRDKLDKGEREVAQERDLLYYYRPPNWKLGLMKEVPVGKVEEAVQECAPSSLQTTVYVANGVGL